ncbi:hypothetical protein SAMN05421639_103287 [Chryseobacterium shigense]|uniref:Uncharacterized protein n=2 Tax=Chryseobacterium shigense TaxID=297244 RepID=A0A1N7IEC1_9FLAO|nr:hypothetical protein [Chryseobacterium shigense]SIS35434.1 hypothetical protein SAMN05421639_103287 [Chryseobacterium shigense]
MFIVKSLVNATWYWDGFAKSLLLGAVTGIATEGLTGGMSASGFQGAVIVGSMNGAISGGVDALFNKENFFTGMYRGAIFGAATAGIVSGISWVVNQLSNSYQYRINEMLVSDDNTLQGGTRVDFSYDTVKKVDKLHYKNQFIRGSYKIVDETSNLSQSLRANGYTFDNNSGLLDGPRGKAWGVTESLTHKGKLVWQRIYLPEGTFVSLEQLDLTMGHEIFHSILNNARLFNEFRTIWNQSTVSVHEYYTSRWEQEYIIFRGWGKLNLNMGAFNTAISTFEDLEPLMNKIKPIFNNYLKSTLK